MKLWDTMCALFARTKWPRMQALWNGGMYYRLIEDDHDTIRALLQENHLLIFTRRRCHLTTYLISLLSMIVSHKPVHYAHVLMNVEGDIAQRVGYKLIEATNSGVHFSTFMQVFNCDSVALMKPRGVVIEEWTKVIAYVKNQNGKPYDNVFNIADDTAMSCVELVYWGLKQLPDYETQYPKIIEILSQPLHNVTPQMLYDTGEFDVVFEVRR